MGLRLRRATVLAAALLLLPNIAQAAFRAAASAPLTVGTATLATPADMSLAPHVPPDKRLGRSVKSFSQVALADGYLLQVSQAGQEVASQRVAGPVAVILTFARGGAFELSIVPTLKTWTAVPLVRTFAC